MGTYEQSTPVAAPADDLFAFLSDVHNLPRYMARMTEAEPAGDDEVHTKADLGDREVEADAWFHVHDDAHRIEWGSEGPNHYHGELEVSGDDRASEVVVRVTTERAEGPEIERGLAETVANVKRLVEGG